MLNDVIDTFNDSIDTFGDFNDTVNDFIDTFNGDRWRYSKNIFAAVLSLVEVSLKDFWMKARSAWRETI